MGQNNARRSMLVAANTIAVTLLFCATAMAYPADLDPSFGGDGRVTTDFAPANDLRDDIARDVAVLSDGKIVVAGEAQGNNQMDVGLARYNADGSLDASFGSGGKAIADLTGTGEHVSAVALQPDGKITVVGYAGGANSTDFFVARFDANGSPDASFGTGGKVTTDFLNQWGGSGYDEAYDVAVQPDGQIVVSGQTDYDNFALARYNEDGSLDPSFDEDGRVVTDLGGYGEAAVGLVLQPDGKIVAAGSTDYDNFALARYNEDGSLDPSFDEDGKLVGHISSGRDSARDVVVDTEGKIVVAGSVNSNAALVRYASDGSLDPTFGQTGKAINTDAYEYEDLAFQADGKIVAKTDYSSWGLARHRADGTLDRSLQVSYGWGEDAYPYAYGMALQADGRVVLAGKVENASGFADFAVARYKGGSDDAAPQTSITRNPSAATPNNYADFYSSSSEARSTFECSLDGAAFARCYDGYGSYYQLASGTHTFKVRATDAAGNTDPTPATWTWKVDRARPTGRVVINGGKASTTSQRVFLKLTASDPAPASGAYQVRIKNENRYSYSAWQALTPSKAWTLSPRAGTKTVSVQFRDRAGNVSTTALDRIAYRP